MSQVVKKPAQGSGTRNGQVCSPRGKVDRCSGGERCAEATLLVAFKRAVLPLRTYLQTAIQELGRHHGRRGSAGVIRNQEGRAQPY